MADTTRLAHAFVELADTLVDDFDVIDFLQVLCERCVQLTPADAAGLMLADERGVLRLVASTQEESRLLELFELQVEQGPCLDSFTSGEQVVNVPPAEAARRWPRFQAGLAMTGYTTAHSMPMRLRTQVVGGLNLFVRGDGLLPEEDVAVGRALADVATIGLLQERSLREQTVLSEQLQTALHSRVLVEQAKGALAVRLGVEVGEAFDRMRSYARRSGTRLSEVAQQVVDGSLDVARIDAG